MELNNIKRIKAKMDELEHIKDTLSDICFKHHRHSDNLKNEIKLINGELGKLYNSAKSHVLLQLTQEALYNEDN